jgi:hypothetical protein
MPLINFDFILYPYIDNKKIIGIYRPVIPVSISAKQKIYPHIVNCLVDSGADYNLFPAAIGENLGLQVKAGEKFTHTGIANVNIDAYKHKVILFIGGYKITTDVHFSYNHKIPLLGRDGFFKFFKTVTFNEEKLQLKLKY